MAASGTGAGFCGNSSDLELLEEMICFSGKPGGVAGLEDRKSRVLIAEHGEEGLGDGEVEGGFWRQLEEDGAKFASESLHFCQEVL